MKHKSNNIVYCKYLLLLFRNISVSIYYINVNLNSFQIT